MESRRSRLCNRRRRMASHDSVYLLRIDAIHHFVMIQYKASALITYRRQVADYIHAFGVILPLRANELTNLRFCDILKPHI